jgi:hypothetical protein
MASGDLVDVVGYPELDDAAPILRDAIVRKTGHAALPEPVRVDDEALASGEHDCTRVQFDARLVNRRSKGLEEVLELQLGVRTCLALLHTNQGVLQQVPLQSRVRVTGVYVGRGEERFAGRDPNWLLLNSARDVLVLERPPWWTLRRATLAGVVLLGLLMVCCVWIMVLYRQLTARPLPIVAVTIPQHPTDSDLANPIPPAPTEDPATLPHTPGQP